MTSEQAVTASHWLTPDKAKVLIEHIQDGIFVIENGHIAYANDVMAELCGERAESMLGRPFTDFVAAEDREMVVSRYQARLRGEDAPEVYSFHLQATKGRNPEVQMSVGLVTDDNGRKSSIGTVRNITEQRDLIKQLVDSQKDIQSILDNLPDVFYRTDMQGVITMISSSCHEALGYTSDEMIGRKLADFYVDPTHRERVLKALMAGGGKAKHVEAALRHKDGQPCWISTNAYIRLDDEGKPYCVEGIARNITERKQIEEEMARLAQTDDLTGLFSRRYLLSEAEQQIRLARRYQRTLAVAMLDLDHFKRINDEYGHAAGDQVLVNFAALCREIVRESDLLGRLGGEEFVLLLPETGIEMACQMAERVRAKVEGTPIILKGVGDPVHVTVSIGVAEMNRAGERLDDLINRADDALYQAKADGRNRVVAL